MHETRLQADAANRPAQYARDGRLHEARKGRRHPDPKSTPAVKRLRELIDQGIRIDGIVTEEIDKVAIGFGLNPDEVGHFVGMAMIARPGPDGQPMMSLEWFVLLSLRMPLLGTEKPTLQFPTIVPGPVPGFMPPDAAFRDAVQSCLRKLDEMKTGFMSSVSRMPTVGPTMPMPGQG